ncbi:MAG: hypothetical protein D6708_08760 [Candidatus Dadabacteria bacterium]|nr:MAG: hypothetical protein D6708_08760 [Candidatus Dadabacteria bacterium]
MLPTGETHMGVLGGSGLHSAWGMRVWEARVGLVAGHGPDLPLDLRRQLLESGVDLSGVWEYPEPTARAWQIFEFDQHRTELFRTPEADFYRRLPTAENIPPAYWDAAGFHLLQGPAEALALAQALRRRDRAVLLAEPPPGAYTPARLPEFARLLPAVDVFSPNLEEAGALLEEDDPARLAARFLEMGAAVVALRMGAAGSLVAQAKTGESWRIPAYPARVVDVTGAGNSYCGGFLVGYVTTGDPLLAGRMAAVSASFTVEQFGLPPLSPGVEAEARRRLTNRSSAGR